MVVTCAPVKTGLARLGSGSPRKLRRVPFLTNDAGAADKRALITFGHSKRICSIEYDTRADRIELSTAAVVTDIVDITKPCVGEVIATFSTEASNPINTLIRVALRATCIGDGGFSRPCSVGEQIFLQSPARAFCKSPARLMPKACKCVQSPRSFRN
jgi:hypothetical protein